MQKFQGSMLLRVLDLLHGLEEIGKLDPTMAHGSETYQSNLNSNIETLIDQLRVLDAPVSVKKARSVQVLSSLPRDNYAPAVYVQAISQSLKELRDRIVDELDDRTLYYVEPKRAELLLAGQDIFGNDVLDALPKASTDISEAAACLAWDRYTACVFHLMRAMEFALREAGKKLDCVVFDKSGAFLSWGPIISNMDASISGLSDKDEKREWSEVRALLYHVKQSWRNDTMHPKRTYTQEEAITIFHAVKSFLRSLSILVSSGQSEHAGR